MISWEQFLQQHATVKDTCIDLGNFGPTTNVSNKEIKGYTWDYDESCMIKTYYSSDTLRRMGLDLLLVASYLDQRALEDIKK